MKIERFFFLVLICNAMACSDGSSPNTASQPDQSVQNLNSGLTGNLWIADDGSRFSLDTGETTKVSDGRVYPSRDGTEYVEVIDNYRLEPEVGCLSNPGDVDQINIRDTRSGDLKSSFEKILSIRDPIRISPDGQSIAMFTANTEVCDDEFASRLTIYSRTGDEIIQSKLGFVSFDWLPDNRLVFFIKDGEDSFQMGVETERHSLNFSTVARLNGPAVPGQIKASPDGSKVLVELISGYPQFLSGINYREAVVLTIDIDGDNFTQVFDSNREGDARVNRPVWSPDGNSILVTENYTSGANTTFYGYDEITTIVTDVNSIPVATESITYVVPANAGLINLPPSQYSEIVKPVFAYKDGVLSAVGFNPIYDQNWTPSID